MTLHYTSCCTFMYTEEFVPFVYTLCVCSCWQAVKKCLLDNLTELCRKAGLSSLEIVSCSICVQPTCGVCRSGNAFDCSNFMPEFEVRTRQQCVEVLLSGVVSAIILNILHTFLIVPVYAWWFLCVCLPGCLLRIQHTYISPQDQAKPVELKPWTVSITGLLWSVSRFLSVTCDLCACTRMGPPWQLCLWLKALDMDVGSLMCTDLSVHSLCMKTT